MGKTPEQPGGEVAKGKLSAESPEIIQTTATAMKAILAQHPEGLTRAEIMKDLGWGTKPTREQMLLVSEVLRQEALKYDKKEIAMITVEQRYRSIAKYRLTFQPSSTKNIDADQE